LELKEDEYSLLTTFLNNIFWDLSHGNNFHTFIFDLFECVSNHII